SPRSPGPRRWGRGEVPRPHALDLSTHRATLSADATGARSASAAAALRRRNKALENELQPQLQLARRRHRVRDARGARDPGAVDVEQAARDVRRREIRPVEQVEDLCTELDVLVAEPEVLEHRQV